MAKPISICVYIGIVKRSDDHSPEIPTTELWRRAMREARKAQSVTQVELAQRVRCTQPVIAGIERGSIKSSTLVIPICDELKIPPPHVLVEDSIDERWIEVGRRLRRKMPALFDGQLAGIESMLKSLEKAETDE